MFWADKIAKNIIDSEKYKPYWVDDMKTPSGRIHVGSLRGVTMHDLIYKALLHAGHKATFTYVFDDHDPMDALPAYLDKNKWEIYLGQPLFTVPSPDGEAESYARYFADEFRDVFNNTGSHPEIIWTSELYKSGKMNEGVRLCLNHADIIRKIYEELYQKKMAFDWYPFQIVCSQCGKESTTRVSNWDGKEVEFTCKVDAVDWTQGCGFSGKTSPFSGDGKFVGKLSWKVEWAVKWMVIGVTVEGAGKDHMTAGGSHDVASRVCERVLKYPVPYPFAHEFFLIGGKKMSSSKGLGSSAKEISEIIPLYLVRFIFTRIDYREAINFDPVGTLAIPDLFDEYDRCWQALNTNSEPDLARAFELAQIGKIPEKKPKLFLPRFRDVANLAQLPNVKLHERFEQFKGSKLTDQEKDILKERLSYAFIWLSKYAPDEYRYQISTKSYDGINLSKDQWDFLNDLAKIWEQVEEPEKLQSQIFHLAKTKNIEPSSAFKALYTVILDKLHGPRAGWLLKKFPKETILERLNLNKKQKTVVQEESVNKINRPDLISIDSVLKQKYPSMSVGIAVIKEVHIKKIDAQLEQEKSSFLNQISGLTTRDLGKYPEIVSYRKLYKEMGIDWHSRRPSPEALLRRTALKKGLYTVNTCVDAYNLVVMKNRVSVGAFDFDQIKFPTQLRYARDGEEILLLGDSEPSKYTAKEIAYFDQIGGYNLDFNYRDAQRTMVTEKTKNLWVNVEGIFDITSNQVVETLQQAVEIILKYCGGEIEVMGIVT